ncbi:MAG: PP2C family protein-serine/threonine phosphatase [Thioalkalivibrionaceae bacterium]
MSEGAGNRSSDGSERDDFEVWCDFTEVGDGVSDRQVGDVGDVVWGRLQGPRAYQQDRCLVGGSREGRQLLLAVADGMGGVGARDAGALAAEAALGAVGRAMRSAPMSSDCGVSMAPWFDATFAQALDAVIEVAVSAEDGVGSSADDVATVDRAAGCTLLVAMVCDDWLECAYLGDTRCLVIRDRQVWLVSEPHRDAANSGALYRGLMCDQTRARDARPDRFRCRLKPGDTVILASDGAWEAARDRDWTCLARAWRWRPAVWRHLRRVMARSDPVTGQVGDNASIVAFRVRRRFWRWLARPPAGE